MSLKHNPMPEQNPCKAHHLIVPSFCKLGCSHCGICRCDTKPIAKHLGVK